MDSMTIEIKLALLAFCVLMFFAIGMIVGYVIGWEKQKGEMDAIARTLEGGREMSDDLINRQAAIRWVKTECNPYGKPTLDFKSGVKVIEHLKQMPSAGSEKHTGNARKTHACDWISRQDAIDAVIKRDANCGIDSAEVLKTLPSAEPKIIYCKDCVKHGKRFDEYPESEACPLTVWRVAQGHEFDYQFCVYGEKKTDE